VQHLRSLLSTHQIEMSPYFSTALVLSPHHADIAVCSAAESVMGVSRRRPEISPVVAAYRKSVACAVIERGLMSSSSSLPSPLEATKPAVASVLGGSCVRAVVLARSITL